MFAQFGSTFPDFLAEGFIVTFVGHGRILARQGKICSEFVTKLKFLLQNWSDLYDSIDMGQLAEIISALCSLGSMAVGAVLFFSRRHKKLDERVNRIAVEVRYTQKSSTPPIRPFYDGEL